MPDQPAVPIAVIAAVHHPTRRRILELLDLTSPATVGAIAAELGVPVGSVSHHLKTLAEVGLVEPDDGPSSDRRQSWWRRVPHRLSWSLDEFTGPERLMAQAAEVENLQHQTRRVMEWFAMRDELDAAWTTAAFSTDDLVRATPAQLADLGRRATALIAEWAAECAASSSSDRVADEAEQHPVFVFARGLPVRP